MRLLRIFKNVIRKFLISKHTIINKYVCNIGFETEGIYLIATKRGLYQLRNNKLFLVLLGDCYGVTRGKAIFLSLTKKFLDFYIAMYCPLWSRK